MNTKFVSLYNSIATSTYTCAEDILKLRSSNRKTRIRTDGFINAAFNILAVSEGIRTAGLIAISPKWKSDTHMNLHHMPWRNICLIANSDAMSEAKFKELGHTYNGNDPKTNIEMGRHLGYIQPSASKDTDGVVVMLLKLPNTEYDDNANAMYTIVSEYGPQSIKTSSTKALNKMLRTMKDKWSTLAKQIHKEFEVFVRLEFR